jgi:hypothetical protein
MFRPRKKPDGWGIAVETYLAALRLLMNPQIQFPDHLYREAKRIADEFEMSFAEVVRRGLEEAIKGYPAGRTAPGQWSLPASRRMGRPILPEEEWDLAARDEA